MANVEQWSAAIRTKISEAIQIHGSCALPFSGGFESCLLLHLAQPWKDQIVVLTVDTGAVFPHVVSFFDKSLTGWNHKTVRTDVRTYLETAAGGRCLVSSSDCCYRHRTGPGQQAVKDLKLRAVLSDQLGGNRNVPSGICTFDGVTNIPLLWGYTRAEVQEMISTLGVELPDHYPEFDAPHGCSICPAALTAPREVWMAKLYPDELATAKGFAPKRSQPLEAAMIARGLE
jgi:hypothetical protein